MVCVTRGKNNFPTKPHISLQFIFSFHATVIFSDVFNIFLPGWLSNIPRNLSNIYTTSFVYSYIILHLFITNLSSRGLVTRLGTCTSSLDTRFCLYTIGPNCVLSFSFNNYPDTSTYFTRCNKMKSLLVIRNFQKLYYVKKKLSVEEI